MRVERARNRIPIVFALAVAAICGAVACREVSDPDERGVVEDTDSDTSTAGDTDTGTGGDGCSPSDGAIDCVFYVDVGAPAPGDGQSWATAFRNVRHGIDAAFATVEPYGSCQVWVAEGVYYVYESSAEDTVQLEPFVSVYGGFAGTESECHERDIEAHETVLSGADGPDSSTRVLHVVTGASAARIDGFTITQGRSEGDGSYGDDGAGMMNYNCDSHLVVANCTFTANEGVHGAGVANYFSTPRFEECVFDGNTADSGGGAMLNGNASPLVKGCEFRGNTAVDNGGAVYNHDESFPVFHNCIFSENVAQTQGGAVYSDSGGAAIVANALFVGNSAGGDGGAIVANGGGDTLTSCTFVGNSAGENHGNAVSCMSGCDFTISNSVLWDGGDEIWNQGSDATVVFSVVQGGCAGTGNSSGDPLLDESFRPTAASPCVDAGDASLLPADELDLDEDGDVSEPLPVDLDGAARVVGGGVDVGAFELQ